MQQNSVKATANARGFHATCTVADSQATNAHKICEHFIGLMFCRHLCRAPGTSVSVHCPQPALSTRLRDKVDSNLCLALACSTLKSFAGACKSNKTILTQSQKVMGPHGTHTQKSKPGVTLASGCQIDELRQDLINFIQAYCCRSGMQMSSQNNPLHARIGTTYVVW